MEFWKKKTEKIPLTALFANTECFFLLSFSFGSHFKLLSSVYTNSEELKHRIDGTDGRFHSFATHSRDAQREHVNSTRIIKWTRTFALNLWKVFWERRAHTHTFSPARLARKTHRRNEILFQTKDSVVCIWLGMHCFVSREQRVLRCVSSRHSSQHRLAFASSGFIIIIIIIYRTIFIHISFSCCSQDAYSRMLCANSATSVGFWLFCLSFHRENFTL